jgi:hypothetical protein
MFGYPLIINGYGRFLPRQMALVCLYDGAGGRRTAQTEPD